MPHIYVTPTLEPVLVMKRGIISVPGDKDMLYQCNGTRIRDIPLAYRSLQIALYEAGKAFVRQQAARGNQYYDREDIHVYGPYPSYGFNDHVLSVDDPALREGADPRLASALVQTRAQTIEAWADYLLVAKFIAQPERVEFEIKKEESDG